ncbi:MAG: hypothetical protein UHD64_07895 [Bacteroidales bacterium]|nr:hypothetical protein [Bacteroidales bacterium]
MGFLKTIKGAFIEEVPNENYDISTDVETVEEVTTEIDVELEGVDTNTLINDVYTQNDLFDMSHSIFKVEELIASLPKEMATDTKRASVLAILSSFNLTATEVVEDGEKRVDILKGVKDKIDSDCKITIADKETQIEDFKKAIEALTVEIANEYEKMKKSDEIISAEIAKVDALVGFVGGEN